MRRIPEESILLEINDTTEKYVNDIKSILNKNEGAEVHFLLEEFRGICDQGPLFPSYQIIIIFIFTSITAGFLSEIGKDAWKKIKSVLKNILVAADKTELVHNFTIEIIYNSEDIYYRIPVRLDYRNTPRNTLNVLFKIILNDICRLEADPLSWEPLKTRMFDNSYLNGTKLLNAHALYFKGYRLYTLGKYDEAIKAYDRAIGLDPLGEMSAFSWVTKGDALQKLGRTKEAQEAFAKARKLWKKS